MPTPTAAERNAFVNTTLAAIKSWPEGEQYHAVIRVIHALNPDKIPNEVDGRRMSSAEAQRRLAMRKDRAQDNWDHRGKGNYGIVVHCPTLIGDRLVYLDQNQASGAWVVRDFIKGERLDNDHAPHLTVNDFLKDVCSGGFCETPPRINAETNAEAWKAHLTERTRTVLKLPPDKPISEDRPHDPSNEWKPLGNR